MNSSQYDWAKNIPCRNIQIHGFCKFEHKGCSYNHDLALQKNNTSPSNTTALDTGSTSKVEDAEVTNSNVNPTTKKLNLMSQQFAKEKEIPNINSTPITLSTKETPSVLTTNLSNAKTPLNNAASNNTPISNGLTSSPMTKKFSLDSPAFTPTQNQNSNKFSTKSPSLDNIPTFVPSISSNSISEKSPIAETATIASTLRNNLNQTETNNSIINSNKTVTGSPFADFSSLKSTLSKTNSFNPITAPVFTPKATPSSLAPDINPIDQNFTTSPQHSAGEDLFYQNTNLYPINFLLYAPLPPPHVELNKKPNERTVDDLFISTKLREYLQLKNEESLKSISNNELDLPIHVGPYHSLYPIDHNFDYNTKSFGYTSIVYKCMSNEDGRLYTMRRLQNVPISSPSVLKCINKWKKVECANCVKVYDVFTTRAFNDNSLILIYDYYPMSLTLMENHFMSFPGKNPELITEDSLWNYTIQLLNAITEVHKLGLTLGPLDSSKIIITNKGRIRLSSIGMNNLLEDVKQMLPDDSKTKETNKKDSDLLNLGNLILFLAKSTNFLKIATENPIEIIPQLKFTNTFKKMLLYLFEEDATIGKFQELVAPMILKLANSLQNSCDYMESNLMSELENARLVRLFTKLDFISERPENTKDGSWSETGERYPIKLFKDYVFHQVDDKGNPVIDLTHVINCLNKLDAGVDENILLVSPDEMSCLIMSYKDLKVLVNKSFLQLLGKT